MPPPKSKKKKSKSSKSTLKGKSAAKEASLPRSKPLNDLRKQAEELCEEWEASSQRKALLEQINAKICSRESIFIDNALCLGLGSLEESNLTPLPGWTSSNIEDDTTDYQNLSWSSQEDTMRFKPVAKGRKRNWSLYQLLVFETAISCLREKFPIGPIRFQDPAFTKRDQEFLQQRGHSIIEWNALTPTHSMDPRLSEFLSPSTMTYLPFLDLTIIVEVIHTAKPSLYFGVDLIGTTVYQNLLRNKRINHLMDKYESMILAYDFDPVAAFGGDRDACGLGFMWKADFADKDVLDRVTARNNRILEKERRIWKHMDEFLTERKIQKEAKLIDKDKEGS